jgi:hypothetical protein
LHLQENEGKVLELDALHDARGNEGSQRGTGTVDNPITRFFDRVAGREGESSVGSNQLKVLKRGHAMRVIFFYPGEEGTYVDNAQVTLYENGIIHIASNQEETTTHLQNCEILWRFEVDGEDRANKVRLLKPKLSPTLDADGETPTPPRGGPGKGKSPELQ